LSVTQPNVVMLSVNPNGTNGGTKLGCFPQNTSNIDRM
jgi:hypothetical protein